MISTSEYTKLDTEITYPVLARRELPSKNGYFYVLFEENRKGTCVNSDTYSNNKGAHVGHYSESWVDIDQWNIVPDGFSIILEQKDEFFN